MTRPKAKDKDETRCQKCGGDGWTVEPACCGNVFEATVAEPVPLHEPAPADGWVRVEDGLPEVRDDVFFLSDGELFWCEYDGGWTNSGGVHRRRRSARDALAAVLAVPSGGRGRQVSGPVAGIDLLLNDYPVCPHCGHEHADAFEWGDSGDDECERCLETFHWERETRITYTTSLVKTRELGEE